MKKILMTAAAALTLAACGPQSDQPASGPYIGRQQITLTSDRLTPEALWALGRIGSVAVDEANHRLAYSVSYYSVEQNKSNSELYLQMLDEQGKPSGEAIQLTHDNFHQSDPAWMQDGRLAYLSSEGGKSEVWAMTIDSTGVKDKQVIASMEGDIEGFILSPDEKKILLISQVKTVPTTADKYPDLPKASGRVVTDLMYKHWDEWTETAPHPFVADFDGKKATHIEDILEGEPYECPMKPFGGTEQLCWSPDSRYIAYTCRKKTGIEYACSTNSDIYLYDTQNKETQNLSEGMMGYDTNPQFSPDGKKIAWQSMERDGYESDQNRLMVMNGETRELTFVSEALETSVEEYFWADDSTLVFTACWHALVHIYSANLQGEIKELSDGQYDFSLCGKMGNQVICKRHSMREPDEIYAQSMSDKSQIMRISHENDYILSQIEMGQVEARWQETTDGKQMLTWIIYPPHFDKTNKYPTLLYCEGGPQSPVSQFWSYRWNFMMMAANDYIVVAPNRRGLPGFGNDWNEQISGDYGGQCMKDYLVAIDEFTASMPFVDRAHLGCVGASFGGFSVYWLAGHHEGRFKAFIAHDGIFNMEMQYLETEEKWFANWDMGGAYWDKKNAVAQRTFQNSPHLFVDKWDTPILCIHGEKDYRILANQGMAAFDAAKMRGVEAELLIFPDENHWVLKPQNGVLWQRTFYEWLDKWLKVND